MRMAEKKKRKLPDKLKPSRQCLALIEHFEGFSATAYRGPGERYLTIGFGHYGPDVKAGARITRAQARKLLRQDLAAAEAAVKRSVKVRLTQGQFDALVSFAYNVGGGALASSTLLRKLNNGRYRRARWQLHRWVRGSHGLPLLGLVRRRRAEAKLWRTGRFQ